MSKHYLPTNVTRALGGGRSHCCCSHVTHASDDSARILDVLPGTNLLALQRVRMADDEPMAVETSTLIASLCPGLLERYDFARESLYNVLRRDYGLVLAYAEQTIEARQATREEADALHIPTGSPVLYMTRVTYSEREKPIEYVRSTYRSTLHISIELAPIRSY